jgi:CubicO group peptidase (beta-lactamase class C family)
VPEQRDDGWKAASLSAVGMNARPLQAMLDRIEDNTFQDIHSVLIARDGVLVFETYFSGNAWDYDAEGFRGQWTEFGIDTPHNMASVTKSITGILLGIAVDLGCIASVDEKLYSFFPDYTHLSSDVKDRISLGHVLTMTSGLHWNEQDVFYSEMENDIVQLFIVSDPVEHVLSKPMREEPGTRWYYNGGGTNLLGEVIQATSGMRLDAFAQEYLFAPLGITGYEWVFVQPDFVYASGDIKLRPREMLKIGQLMLDRGVWNGERVLSEEWAEALVTEHVSHGPNAGYGFHWWLRTYSVNRQSVDSYRADGWGGQRIMVFPDLDLVVVFTGGNYTQPHRLDEIVTEFILPAVMGGDAG